MDDDPQAEGELVTVFVSSHDVDLAIAKSYLDAAKIYYYAKGESLQNLFGWGTVSLGYNPIVGAVDLQVFEENAANARELLAGLAGVTEAPPEPTLEDMEKEEAGLERLRIFQQRLGIGFVVVVCAFLACCMIYHIIQMPAPRL